MRTTTVCLLFLVTDALAFPDPSEVFNAVLWGSDVSAKRFAFSASGIHDASGGDGLGGSQFRVSPKLVNEHVALDAAQTTAWIASDVQLLSDCFDKVTPAMKKQSDEPFLICPKNPKEVVVADGRKHAIMGTLHSTCLVEKASAGWEPLACHVGSAITGAAQNAAIKKGVKLAAIKRSTKGAEDVVKLFESTIGDPKAFANTISDRKDVVLYGSEAAERYVGGAKVAKQLSTWGLTMKVRDGIDAGVTSNKSVAWVAANIDASTAKFKSPYRVLAIYERTGATWKIVQIHFSFPRP